MGAVFKVFLFLLVTAALLTSRERIHALIWVMVLSLAFFGIKGGGFTLLSGGADRVFGPDGSMINDNNHLATALLVSIPLMNYLRMESRHAIIRYGLARRNGADAVRGGRQLFAWRVVGARCGVGLFLVEEFQGS